MKILFKKAEIKDANLLVNLYDAAFYADYLRYGYCPAYGSSKEKMEESIKHTIKYSIWYEAKPVGVLSFENEGNGNYHLGCLCVIPEYQGKGIGTQAVQFMKTVCTDWKCITLETPADKKENVKFYTQKCGFMIVKTIMDENVKLDCFIQRRNFFIKKSDILSKDAEILLGELNTSLLEITGNSGEHSFSKNDFLENKGEFLMGYLNNQPIACGAIRKLSQKTAEIKRVYSRKNAVGAAHAIVLALENKARCDGFKEIQLETRAVNQHAIDFYLACGYKPCPNYGKYIDRKDAVCFSKNL